MLNLLGEFDCKLDAKARLMLPAALKKQLGASANEGFVINRDIFEQCLVLYPMVEWKKISGRLEQLNPFVKKDKLFKRRFNNGATLIELDDSGRMLLPKHLQEYASLDKDVKVLGNGETIEIWSKANYDAMLKEDIDFAALSEDVMGGIDEARE
ncbi:MAG: division/cell wall cluster transcriptional repressor MraZ [Luteibaculaceae bacterium]